MEERIKRIAKIYKGMVKNHSTYMEGWRNYPLIQEALDLFSEMPLRYGEELTPYSRIFMLEMMMENFQEEQMPRLSLKIRDYQQSLFGLISDEDLEIDMSFDHYEGDKESYVRDLKIDDIEKHRQKLIDYIDLNISTEDWCRKYGRTLKFDPIERTEEWENAIYEVEKRCYELTKNKPKGMGFCFEYWNTKRNVLAKYGIEWRNPHMMNPRVMFD